MTENLATVHVLTTEPGGAIIRVLMTAIGPATFSMVEQLEECNVNDLNIFGRVFFPGERCRVLGEEPDSGELCWARLQPDGWPREVNLDPILDRKMQVCRVHYRGSRMPVRFSYGGEDIRTRSIEWVDHDDPIHGPAESCQQVSTVFRETDLALAIEYTQDLRRVNREALASQRLILLGEPNPVWDLDHDD